MKILVATEKPFAKVAVEGIRQIIESAGHELVTLESYTDKAQLLAAVADVHALIIRSDLIDAEVMTAAPQLKIIVRAGAGYDNVDLATATARNIVVMNTPGQNSNAVAELVFGMLIFNARHHFNGKSGSELKGKTLGIVAYGQVGRNVTRIAKGMEMEVHAYDFFDLAERMKADGVTKEDSIKAIFEKCDIVSLHLPATADTKQSINRALVGLMKPKAVLINTARKEIINETELLALLLTERPDLTYLTDIRPDLHNEYAEALGERYFATPKEMGAQTAEANINAGLAAARQICSFFADGCTKFQVN